MNETLIFLKIVPFAFNPLIPVCFELVNAPLKFFFSSGVKQSRRIFLKSPKRSQTLRSKWIFSSWKREKPRESKDLLSMNGETFYEWRHIGTLVCFTKNYCLASYFFYKLVLTHLDYSRDLYNCAHVFR